jgi:hypothetical protein
MTDWQAALKRAVDERWNDEKVFFVAEVKPFLTKQGVDVETLLKGRQVRYFIDSEMPELKQIQHDHEPTNWGLVPNEAVIEPPTARYFGRDESRRRESFPFQNALRVAFTRPLETGRVRWLVLHPLRFLDLPAGEAAPSGIEILRAEIEAGASGEELVTRIEAFLRSSGVDPEAFRTGQARPAPPPRGRTALHQFLSLIPASDLSRVSIPLDLVRRLLDQSDDASR